MKKIKLTQGKYALVDDDNYEELSKYNWQYNKGGYAIAHDIYDMQKSVYMHRVINKTPNGFHTDHINQNKLDNRKENLRTATVHQNLFNTKLFSHNTSGYRGLYWYERYKKWEVYITIHGKRIYLKRFKNLQDAIKARKDAELKYCESFK